MSAFTPGFRTSVDGTVAGGALGAAEVVVCGEGLDAIVDGCDALGVGASADALDLAGLGRNRPSSSCPPFRRCPQAFTVPGSSVSARCPAP